MAGGREVTLTIKVDDADVAKAQASIERLKASASGVRSPADMQRDESFFKDLEVWQKRKESIAEIQKQVRALDTAMQTAPNEATFAAKYRSELIDLLTTVRGGSKDVEDYSRRLKLIPPAMQDAIKVANELSAAQKVVGGATRDTHAALNTFITGLMQVEASTGSSGRHLRTLEMGLGNLGSAGGIAGIAIISLLATLGLFIYVGYKVNEAIIGITKAFADYTNQLDQAAKKNDVSIQTVQALTLAADEQGVKFSAIEGIITKYRETVGKAAGGNEEARKSLQALGVDGTKAIYNIDGSFKTALLSIERMPEGLNKTILGLRIFGDNWTEVDGVLQTSHGNVNLLIQKLQDLGLVASRDSVTAAREFHKAWADAKAEVTALENKFGKEFIPTVTKGLKEFGDWLTRNKATIQDWAEWTGKLISGVVKGLHDMVAFIEAHPYIVRGNLAIATQGGSEVVRALANSTVEHGTTTPSGFYDPWKGISQDYQSSPQAGPDIEALKAQLAERQKQLEKQAEYNKKEWEARIKDTQSEATESKKGIQAVYKSLEDDFSGKDGKPPIGADAFKQQVANALSQYEAQSDAQLKALDYLEKEKARRDDAGPMELKALLDEQLHRRKEYADESTKIEKEMRDKIAGITKTANAEAFTEQESRTKHEIEQIKSRATEELRKVTADHVSGIGATGTYTQEEQRFLKYTQGIATGEITSQVSELQKLMAQTTGDDEGKKKRNDLQGQIDTLNQKLAALTDEQGRQLTPDAQATKDANDELNRIHRQDRDEQYVADRRHLAAKQQEIGFQKEIDGLLDQINNVGVNDALQIEAAHLKDVLDYRNRELNAVIELQHAQYELSHATEISNTQIRAGLYSHMASQTTIQQATIDGWNKTYDAITRVIDGPLDKLDTKTKGFLSFIIEPMKAIQNQAFTNIWHGVVDKVFGGTALGDALKSTGNPMLDEAQKQTGYLKTIADSVTGGSGINPTTGGGGIGGFFKNILHFGGRTLGGNVSVAGGTPPFVGESTNAYNPNFDPNLGYDPSQDSTIGGSRGGLGGIMGSFKDLFKPQRNVLTGKDSKLGGQLGGVGSLMTMAGSFLGDGKLGNVVRDAGMGMQIGANFGPWGAAIGGGIGAIIGLFHHDDASKRLKEAALAQYGINIKDGSVLNALKSLGEGMFGKGNVGKNAAAVVGSQQGRNILAGYAKSSGQSSLQIDRLNYGDPNWAGNDFRLDSGAGSGGSFASYDRGRVTSSMPTIGGPSMQVPQFAAAGNFQGVDRAIMAQHAEALSRIADRLDAFQTMPAGMVVAHGLAGNEDAVADTYHASLQGNAYSGENAARARGEYS